MSPTDAESYPDLDADERTTLSQFLDQYRQRALSRLARLSDAQARTQTLAATNLTPGGVVKHLAHMEDLDTKAPRPSFGKGPVTLRWVMVHMLEETACHVGHLDLLTDPLVESQHDNQAEGRN